MRNAESRLWAIVLAGGTGRRLKGVSGARGEEFLPKQFCRFGTDRSLLERTLDRIDPVAARFRTVVVIQEGMQSAAGSQVAEFPGVRLAVQPADRGTAAGVLLPLVDILVRDPGAEVVVVPSDHDFARPDDFLEGMQVARRVVRLDPARIVLLGSQAGRPASDLGWIVPVARWGGVPEPRCRGVARFVEKPSDPDARRLLAAGGLWNTMIVIARARELYDAFRAHARELADVFLEYAMSNHEDRFRRLRDRCNGLPSVDFSASILQAASNLSVVSLPERAGWTDLGVPGRLFDWLASREGRQRARAFGSSRPRKAESQAISIEGDSP
jgi:mannose-1-phosphate guanylyltransferase